MRLIDADELLKEFDRSCSDGDWWFEDRVLEAPTVAVNRWIGVKDQLPEKEHPEQQRGFYLVALSNGVVKELAFEFDHYDNMLYNVGWHETAYPVTHWMPLPSPPQSE